MASYLVLPAFRDQEQVIPIRDILEESLQIFKYIVIVAEL